MISPLDIFQLSHQGFWRKWKCNHCSRVTGHPSLLLHIPPAKHGRTACSVARNYESHRGRNINTVDSTVVYEVKSSPSSSLIFPLEPELCIQYLGILKDPIWDMILVFKSILLTPQDA